MARSEPIDLASVKHVTAPLLSRFKTERRPITALTCYDFTSAELLNEAGIDLLLVGDSLGMVKLGHDSTIPVTVEDIVYHTRIVARGNSRALLVADMPYLSYHASTDEAVRNAGKMLKSGAAAVKIEGGQEMLPVFDALRKAKIPVIGHLGMTPQSVNVFGGYKVQGRGSESPAAIMRDALVLQQAGVSAIVLECVPKSLGKKISGRLKIPTIGIGAGIGCDGQVLVIDDLLGLTAAPHPRFVKQYANLRKTVRDAARSYAREVRARQFPDDPHSYL